MARVWPKKWRDKESKCEHFKPEMLGWPAEGNFRVIILRNDHKNILEKEKIIFLSHFLMIFFTLLIFKRHIIL